MESNIMQPGIVSLLTIGFAFASILGYLTQRMKMSPILGYLLAGYVIGPYSPGFEVDLKTAEQLAEVGVILMLFGVGLHFRWEDLMVVKKIAIPGAICQTLAATIFGTILIYAAGWPLVSGIIFGIAIGVASTVVLVRVLEWFNLMHSPTGHVAVGWLIVEDMISVIVLLLLPTLSKAVSGSEVGFIEILIPVSFSFLKFFLLLAIMFTIGRRLVTYFLVKVAAEHSQELFTLTMLAITFVIADGSAVVFGTSLALGAFVAGMVIGQSGMRKRVENNSTPLRDAFVVLFFLSIGMIFNPLTIFTYFYLFLGTLAIILIIKPLVAYLIVFLIEGKNKEALMKAIVLAQIGEFSFILAESANRLEILPDEGYDILVACSIISIAINPLLFGFAYKIEMHKGEA